MPELTGKVALVTGGSRGIGRAICLRLAQQGHKIVVNYNGSQVAAEDVEEQIIKLNGPGSALTVQGDIGGWNPEEHNGSFNGAQEIFEKTMQACGRIDILVNNAGIQRDTVLVRMIQDKLLEVLWVNQIGPMWLSREVGKQMMPLEWGRIITITSLIKDVGNFGQTNYAASKGAMSSFTRALARELGDQRYNITVNEVSPGLIDTDATKKVLENEKMLDYFMVRQAVKRPGLPEEVAGAVAYLVSDEAAFVSGACINVNGGF